MSAPTPANPATATAKPTPRRIKSSGTSRGNAWTYVPLVLLSRWRPRSRMRAIDETVLQVSRWPSRSGLLASGRSH